MNKTAQVSKRHYVASNPSPLDRKPDALPHDHCTPRFLVTEDAEGGTCLAIFFPPTSHVLIKVNQDGATVKFTMATDEWKILPLMSDYLRTITSVEE
ncbi:hypothetical protein LSAT2_025894 [Lamellibrachia satsuma]|nr:hypothetical protein LSAT2_025894 [Lamellibrachia satsuma]